MSVLDVGIQIVLWFQGLGGWLAGPMKFFSFLGVEEFYLIVTPVLYWCIDARLGARAGLFLMTSASLNGVLKLAFHTPRPYWYTTQVRPLAAESSFGIPSGHSQDATVLWGTLAAALRRPWGWLLAILVVTLIGISRLYLGVHFPQDVLLGWTFGALLLGALLALEKPALAWLAKRSLWAQLTTALAVSLLLITAGALARLALAGWEIPAAWLENARLAFPDEPIGPMALSGVITGAGAFFGLASGLILMAQRGGFQAGGTFWLRAARYPLGVVVAVAIWMGLGAVFPRGESLLPYVLRFLRYGLLGFWVTYLAPLVFYRLRLAQPRTIEN